MAARSSGSVFVPATEVDANTLCGLECPLPRTSAVICAASVAFMDVLRNRQAPTVWFLVAAAVCMVIGLLGALGPALVWFGLAIVLDVVAAVLFLRRRP